MILHLSAEVSLDQYLSLEDSGFNMLSNVISPSFAVPNKKFCLAGLDQHFPFESQSYFTTYALKSALLFQSSNRPLVEHIFAQMDMKLWRPFSLEIAILLGKAYGTMDPLFLKLFSEDKCYLMGRPLTVEKRLFSFSDSRICPAVMLYYNEPAYQKMLITLAEILI